MHVISIFSCMVAKFVNIFSVLMQSINRIHNTVQLNPINHKVQLGHNNYKEHYTLKLFYL